MEHPVVTAGPPGRELLRATGESLGGAGAAQEGLPQDEHHPLAHLMRHQSLRSAIIIQINWILIDYSHITKYNLNAQMSLRSKGLSIIRRLSMTRISGKFCFQNESEVRLT